MTAEAQRLAELSEAVRRSSLKRLRAVPAGREDWRIHPEAMSFADLAQHLIDADRWLFEKLEDPSLEPMFGRAGLVEDSTRGRYLELLRELQRTGEQRRELLAELSGAELSQRIFDRRFGGQVTVWWVVVRGNLDHEAHHRGQIAAYLAALAA